MMQTWGRSAKSRKTGAHHGSIVVTLFSIGVLWLIFGQKFLVVAGIFVLACAVAGVVAAIRANRAPAVQPAS